MMRTNQFQTLMAGLVILSVHLSQAADTQNTAAIEAIKQVATRGPIQPNWDSLGNYQIPEWYQDAKFGIFIHWGV